MSDAAENLDRIEQDDFLEHVDFYIQAVEAGYEFLLVRDGALLCAVAPVES
jgi:hypothetical protein